MVRRMAVQVWDEKFHVHAKLRTCGEQPRRYKNNTERPERRKKEGLHRDKSNQGAPRQTPNARGDTNKTTNGDTRRKISPVEEAKAEHADARPFGVQLDGALAIAARKSVELEKQLEHLERAQEKLDKLQAEATEADRKVSTLRAEALAAARPQDG